MDSSEFASPMVIPDEIHHSIIDAEDVEEVWDPRITVSGVVRNILGHPAQLITRWNWKSAFLGAILRASFYYGVYQASSQSWAVTLTAVLVELVFRFITTGVIGAAVQSFRRATPVWLANVIVTITLPAISHLVEWATHYAQERYLYDIFASSDGVARKRAFAVSVLFSAISALFNLYAMRHGVLLVGAGEETRTFWEDLKRIPRLVGEFTAYLPIKISKFIERGQFLNALGSFASFGICVGAILGVARQKWQWAWTTALGAWGTLLFALILALVIRRLLNHHLRIES